MKYFASSGIPALLGTLAEAFDVYAPVRRDGALVLQRLSFEKGMPGIPWNDFRLAESLKPLTFQTGKVLARWTAAGPAPGPSPRPRAIFGAKGCDLKAMGIVDRVFRDHTYREPAWCEAREQNLIIAGDCTAHGPSCFCTLLGDHPWPEALHDISLSPVEGGYLVETGTPRGEALLAAHPELFVEAAPAQMEVRDRRRREVEAAVNAHNAAFVLHDPPAVSVEKNVKTRIWGRLAATCVECNACNHVCPTCHCFLLLDQKTADGSERLSVWDSCFHAGYARMAGGGTPRLQLVERFKNHYYHKFVSFPRNWGVTACTGCGRCVDACMGRIDKRKCLHRLETEWIPSEVIQEIH